MISCLECELWFYFSSRLPLKLIPLLYPDTLDIVVFNSQSKIFSEKQMWKSEKDEKHWDATRPSFLCGIFCLWIKKRCQRQIIYFSRRSVIKVFARTPQTDFLCSPITVEIIIIGQTPSILPSISFSLATKKQSKIHVSCGNRCQVKHCWENLKIISVSVWYASSLVKCLRRQHDD